MNRDIQVLKNIRDHLMGLEIEIGLIDDDLQSVLSDLEAFYKMRNRLKKHLELLKSSNIIPIASEYKKSKNELNILNTRIEKWEYTKAHLTDKKVARVKVRNDYLKLYEREKKRIEDRKVILLFRKKKKKNKKSNKKNSKGSAKDEG